MIIRPSKKPDEILIMEKMRSSMKKSCMHLHKEKCKGRIKEAPDYDLNGKRIKHTIKGIMLELQLLLFQRRRNRGCC